MSSMQKMQKLVDEIYIIKESTAEINEEMSEKIDELIKHQNKITAATINTVSKLNVLLKDNVSNINHRTNNIARACNDAIERTEGFIRDIENERQNKIELLKKKRMKIIVSTIVLACMSVFLLWFNFHLGKKANVKYSEIQGIPTTFEEGGEHYVKVKPKTEITIDHEGEEITFAKMA